jgi:hypothetical protein
MRYYRRVLELAKRFVPHGGSLLDVGCHECQYIRDFSWFDKKDAIDIQRIPEIPGVRSIQIDFMDFQPDHLYDLVLCLQVLEHLPNPEAFARKLINSGLFTIVSVPYKWPKGKCKYHCQDPVDELKLKSWFEMGWKEADLVKDGKSSRLIALFGPNFKNIGAAS